MEDLYYQQLELSDLIKKIPINIKKDSAERKTDDYFKRRAEILEKYWSEFQNNHLAICEYGVREHTYFTNSEHEKVSKLYTAAKTLINGQRQQLSSKQTPLKPIRSSQMLHEEQEDAAVKEAGPSGYEQKAKSRTLRSMESRGSSSKLDEMILKQTANFKAFKRSAGFIDLDSMMDKWEMEDALKTPGTSDTGAPSSVSQDMRGAGEPCAAHDTRAPVLLENDSRGGGSIRNSSWHDDGDAGDKGDSRNKN
ncbi:hypothetical protein B5X24_HaOG204532 [Helicoverpa armigera]|uniref:Uncharacterized protein n=1 Tax=Helicoverpa armigera TaxID=29058 RepID=A0A2W1BUL0_HELAM|nr:hypothetical protein B5X24_HaOG204532 [Helicoverpa armigera]